MSPAPQAFHDTIAAAKQARAGAANPPLSDRAVWLAERRNGVGASDVAGILGLSPWASPYSVWADKVFGSDDDPSLAMSFGLRAEPMIAPWFHELTGLWVYGTQSQCQHEAWPWQRCTIDGFVYDHRDEHAPGDCPDGCSVLGAYEAKTTSATPKEWEEDGIPIQYQCQGQWTMHVTGHDHIWFAVLHLAFGRPDLRVYQLDRDQDDIDLIVTAVDTFWNDHVVPGIPPETDGHTATTYATKHLPASAGDMVELSEPVARVVADLADLKATKKRVEEQIDIAENAIRAALGDATEGYHNGQLVMSFRPQTRASYVVQESTFRKLIAHKPKGAK